jgi:transcriptional regulator GlxA family with amidase domain
MLKVPHWLQATDSEEIDLTTLARQAGLARRMFLRRFQKATGLTTTKYCQRLRVGKARELLQFNTLAFDQVDGSKNPRGGMAGVIFCRGRWRSGHGSATGVLRR